MIGMGPWQGCLPQAWRVMWGHSMGRGREGDREPEDAAPWVPLRTPPHNSPPQSCVSQEHRQDPKRSRLRRLVPQLGNFFTPLKLVGRGWLACACLGLMLRGSAVGLAQG